MERFWVPHEELVFAPCWQVSSNEQTATFESCDGQGFSVSLPKKEADALHRVHDLQLAGVDDICDLDTPSAPAVLHTVRVRYQRKGIYTRVQGVLIAVNPFQSLPIYSAAYIDRYINCSNTLEHEPHVFAVGSNALQGLRHPGDSQAILISGESGAGKTETTKLLLSFMGEAMSGSGQIQEQIMQINPVLEAFGNAMTVRNNNSSRFGKWIEVATSKSMVVKGGSVTDYLLEVTRVCSQGEKERNYHIFFQLMQAREMEDFKEMNIKEPSKYTYVAGSTFVAPGVDDAAEFGEVREALTLLGFDETTQLEIFQAVVGILALGNVEFDGDEASKVKSEETLQEAARLFGVTDEALSTAMTIKKITIGREVTRSPLPALAASAARDGLSRLLYGRLFKYLIENINKTLSQGSIQNADIFFGVLDIAGFESFAHNSLEQLFINLSNERLQQHFNTHIFKVELEDYKREGLDVIEIKYQDNSDIVDLIDARGGVLPMLDEEVAVPKGSDESWINKILKTHGKHPRFIPAKFSGDLRFGIRHFAGEVHYSCEGFLEKNKDKPPDDAAGLMQSSTLGVLKELGTRIAEEAQQDMGSRRGSATAKKTVSTKFRTSLAALFQKLNQASPHFIRCIKPNAEKMPDLFTSGSAMEQMLNSGIMEAVRIRQEGYASRLLFEEFWNRYRVILPTAARNKIEAPDTKTRLKGFVEALPEAAGISEKEVVLGNTKVFAKATAVSILDRSRDLAMTGYVITIQRHLRGLQARRMIKQLLAISMQMKEWHDRNPLYTAKGSEHTALAKLTTTEAIDEEVEKLREILDKAHELQSTPLPREAPLKKIMNRMENESKLVQELRFLLPSIDAIEISKALARARDLELPSQAEIQTLEKRADNLKIQIPLVKAMQDALDADSFDDLQSCLEVVKQKGLDKHSEEWIAELKGMELSGRVFDALDRLKAKRKKEADEEKRNAEAEAKRQTVFGTSNKQEAAFTVDEDKEKAKEKERKTKMRAHLMKLSPKEEQDLMAELDAAVNEFDVLKLEEKLGHATRSGVDPEDVQKYQDMFEKLQTEEFLIEKIKEEKAAISTCEESEKQAGAEGDEGERRESQVIAVKTGTLQRLQNLIQQAERIGSPADVIADAKPAMQQGVKQRARSTMRGSVFDHVDLLELAISEAAFSRLEDFPNLKPPSQWAGHRRPGLIGKLTGSSDPMLSHSKLDIKEGLTQLPRAQRQAATQNFRNLLVWMGDKPAPETQRRGYSQAILDLARSDPPMVDEVYVQVMKQLTDNPSKRSRALGWNLLLLLCQAVSPSDDLEEFVRSFLLQTLTEDRDDPGEQDTVAIAKQCIADLNITTKGQRGAIQVSSDVIPVQVMLIDSSARKINCASSSTLSQLGKSVAEQLRVNNAEAFSFFQMIDGVDAHRLLPDNIVLATLLPKWAKLQETTGKKSRLLWKRRFLRVNETLQVGDLMHAKLTYQQAVWDYIHYPISEDLPYICSIAAMLLLSDKDHYAKNIAEKKLHEPGVLEHLLPDYTLRYEQRQNLANQVLRHYQKLAATDSQKDNRLQRMSQVLTLMQRMRLFGTYFWSCKQVYNVPEEKVSLQEAPSRMCEINPKDPEAEYWICVDLFGVRFLSLDSTPGNEYMRGFLLRDESVERVLRWSAKQDILQIIVQTIPNMNSEAKRGAASLGSSWSPVRQPMTIAVASTAAVDIAHTLQCAARDFTATKS